MILYRLAKRTDIRHSPDTGTEWAAGQHPYPQEDGIPEFSTEHLCGAATWAQFRKWWHDDKALMDALLSDHAVYTVYIAEKDVLVGRNQVMFRPEDAIWIRSYHGTRRH